MSDPEDLNAKAARLWAELLQAQAKAAANVAAHLPEVTRALAQAGASFPGDVRHWIEKIMPVVDDPHDKEPVPAAEQEAPVGTAPSVRAMHEARANTPLSRPGHRRLKVTTRTLSRRRAPR
ncbi:MAG: hypothetical protein NVSMB26_14670 [Beijerinckiaceae bacterium]